MIKTPEDLRKAAEKLWLDAKESGVVIENITFANSQMVNGNNTLYRIDINASLIEKAEIKQ